MLLPNEISNTKIKKLNLDYVIEQLLVKRHETGWDLFELLNIEKLYKRFLQERFLNPKKCIVPVYEVDIFWHQHIINTEKYSKDCQNVFGKYLHHAPLVEKEYEADLSSLKKLLLNSIKQVPGVCNM